MFLRNCWYMAGFSYEFGVDGLESRLYLDEPIVIYRKSDGGLVAMEDRCVHRLAPLSMGFREGDDIRCRYHGLKFNAEGQCIDIPGQTTIPDRACVRSYPLAEINDWVWIWMGDPAKADERLVPEIVGLNDPDWLMRSGQADYAASYELINDNLLDLAHLSYVHRDSFQVGPEFAATPSRVNPIERGVRVERFVEQTGGAASGGPVAHLAYYDYLVPGINLLGGKFYPPGSTVGWEGGLPAKPCMFENYNCQAVTPIDAKRCRYFFSAGLRRGPGVEEQMDGLFEVVKQAFAEDVVMIEAQQRVIDRTPGGLAKLMPIAGDRAAIIFQRLMSRMIREEAKIAETRVAISEQAEG